MTGTVVANIPTGLAPTLQLPSPVGRVQGQCDLTLIVPCWRTIPDRNGLFVSVVGPIRA